MVLVKKRIFDTYYILLFLKSKNLPKQLGIFMQYTMWIAPLRGPLEYDCLNFVMES